MTMLCMPKIDIIKKLFLLDYIIMSRKNINFDDKKIRKSNFYENKKKFRETTLMLIIYQFLKKNHMAIKIRLNTLLDIMIMISLDNCVQKFHK